LRQLGNLEDAPRIVEATITETMQSDGRRTYARVKLRQDGEAWYANSTGTQSSGALMSMVLADGLLIIPEGMTRIERGEKLPVRLLRE
jgi:molybdopterin molybdotransferase